MRLLILLSLLTIPMYANSASYNSDTYSAQTTEKEYVYQVNIDDTAYECNSDVIVVDVPYYEEEHQEYYIYDTYLEDSEYDYSANTGIMYPYNAPYYDPYYIDDYYYDVIVEENCDDQLDVLISTDALIASAAAYVQLMQQHILQLIEQILPSCACVNTGARDTITTLTCEQGDEYDYYYDYYYNETPTPSCAQLIKGCIMKALAHAKSFSIGAASGAAIGALESEYAHPALAAYDDMTVVGAYSAALGTAGAASYIAQDTQVGEEFKKPATMIGVLAGLLTWYHFMGGGLSL